MYVHFLEIKYQSINQSSIHPYPLLDWSAVRVPFYGVVSTRLWWTPGPLFNIKMSSYQYRKSHCGDKTILRPSYLHNGISYTGKMTSLYWIRGQLSKHLCVVGQHQPGHIYWLQSSHIQTTSFSGPSWHFTAGNQKVYHDVAGNTWLYHLSSGQRRAEVIPSMPSFYNSEYEDVSSLFLVPQIQRILAWSLRQSHCNSGLFGPHVSLQWSIAAWTQTSYTLLHILGVEMPTFNFQNS